MKIINKPFARRGDRASVANCFYEDSVGCNQLASVILEPRQQLSPAFLSDRNVPGGESLRVLLETLHAEDFRSHRLLIGRTGHSAQLRRKRSQKFTHNVEVATLFCIR